MTFERTAAQQRQAQLPKSFKCRECKKFKEPGLFANKELNSYRYKVSEGHKVNEISAQLRCRTCAGAQLHELKCGGPCGKWLDLQKFSKSSRSAGGLGWCQNCVLWKEAAQPELIPQAPPQGDLAPDEDGDLSFGQNEYYTTTTTTFYGDDPEAGEGSDYDDYVSIAPVVYAPSTATRSQPQSVPASARAFAPATASAPMSATASTCPSAPSSTISVSQSLAATTAAMSQVSLRANGWTNQAAAPPSARPSAPSPMISASQNAVPSTAAMSQASSKTNGWTNKAVRTAPSVKQNAAPAVTSAAVPPHLRSTPGKIAPSLPAARKVSDNQTVSSVSNPYEGLATPTLGVATWGDLGVGRRPTAIEHNAWDSNGQKHVQQRVLSDSRSEVGSAITSASSATTITVTPVQAPPARPATTGRASSWAKAVGSRNAESKYNAMDHQPEARRQQTDYDSDDDM